jgi:hypothetical protein
MAFITVLLSSLIAIAVDAAEHGSPRFAAVVDNIEQEQTQRENGNLQVAAVPPAWTSPWSPLGYRPFRRHLLRVSPAIIHRGQVFRLGHGAAVMPYANNIVLIESSLGYRRRARLLESCSARLPGRKRANLR